MAPLTVTEQELDLGRWLSADDGVVWGQACAEPTALVDALLRDARDIELSAFVGLSWRDLAVPKTWTVRSYGALGRLGRLPGLEVVPCHFSELPALFASGRLPCDVALIQVAPPDSSGRCSLGPGVDYLFDALSHARTVIAEVNDFCPAAAGAWVAWDTIDVAVHTSRPLPEAPRVRPGDLERRIAEHVAELVEDGDTIQLGVGALPEAILRSLSSHRDLGVHSGMISDGILDLIEAGVITNARKATDRRLTVTGAALGSARLFDALPAHEEIVFMPVSYTHAAKTLGEIGPLCAINSALEVDLTGQVGAERAGGRWLGAVGGQVDFLRAASKPIIALPSSRIVEQLSGPVSTARSDVDWIVTEHGARSLKGLSESARTRALLELTGCPHGGTDLHPRRLSPSLPRP